jgi:SAM-dependent methyltransferase
MRTSIALSLLLLATTPWVAGQAFAEPAGGPPAEADVAPPEPREEAVSAEDDGLPRLPDAPFVVTPEEVVEEMLRLAGTGPDDVVYDLGCGDGRIVIAAVRDFAARRGVCVEIDPDLVAEARDNARAAGVAERIRFVEGDLFEVPIGEATVVTLYLLPDLNRRLQPKLLRELAPGSRVVSHDFGIGDWRAEEVIRVRGRTVFLWTVPPAGPGEDPP